jgi:aconitate hydratase
MSKNSFGAKVEIEVAGSKYEIFDITKLPAADSLPFSLKVLLENLLRTEDGANITAAQIEALANWNPDSEPETEIQFTPARVIMQLCVKPSSNLVETQQR